MNRMESLRGIVAAAVAEMPMEDREHADEIANVALAALGLDASGAAIGRLATWLDLFLQTPVSHDTRVHARAALEAALTEGAGDV